MAHHCEAMGLFSLFDGIGGFPLAFASAGVRTYGTVEIDKAAAGVAADHFPEAKHFSDVKDVTPDDILSTGFCPLCGIFCAGWPCTDLSLAGLRLGLGGARSGLVGEVFRLLLGVQPRWFVLENVPGLLSSVCPCPGGGVCGTEACAAGPHVVRGGACGRKSRRGRPAGPGRCMALHGGGMGTVLRRLGECGYGVAYRVLDAQHFGVPQRRRRVVIVGHLGEAAGPAEVLLEPAGGRWATGPGGAATASPAAIAAIGAGSDRIARVAPTLQGGGRRGFRIDAELAAGGGLIQTGDAAVRRMTPVEYERLQGYPDGWTATSHGREQADSPRYRQLGNSIAVPVFAWVAGRLVAVEGRP